MKYRTQIYGEHEGSVGIVFSSYKPLSYRKEYHVEIYRGFPIDRALNVLYDRAKTLCAKIETLGIKCYGIRADYKNGKVKVKVWTDKPIPKVLSFGAIEDFIGGVFGVLGGIVKGVTGAVVDTFSPDVVLPNPRPSIDLGDLATLGLILGSTILLYDVYTKSKAIEKGVPYEPYYARAVEPTMRAAAKGAEVAGKAISTAARIASKFV